jgi:hypothetical protein
VGKVIAQLRSLDAEQAKSGDGDVNYSPVHAPGLDSGVSAPPSSTYSAYSLLSLTSR